MYTINCPINTVHVQDTLCTLHTIRYIKTLCTSHPTLYTLHPTLNTIYYTLLTYTLIYKLNTNTVVCTLYTAHDWLGSVTNDEK